MPATPEHLVDRPAEGNPLARAWLPWALGRIDHLETLDDEEIPAATGESAKVARGLIHAISAWHTVAPDVAPQPTPDGDGGITIVWLEHGYTLEITIEADGHITGWLMRNEDKIELEWPRALTSRMPVDNPVNSGGAACGTSEA